MTLEQLKEKVAQILDVPVSELHDDSGPETIATWDSIGAVQLLTVLDEAYDGNIYEEKTEELVTFGAIVEFARKNGIISD